LRGIQEFRPLYSGLGASAEDFFRDGHRGKMGVRFGRRAMKYVCDAPGGKTWFRIETEAEAIGESALMRHAVEKHFREAERAAARTFKPNALRYVEQEIGLKAHVQREMPLFLTLRDADGGALVTAMLPPGGKDDRTFRPIIVAAENRDPYPEHGDAIEALGQHLDMPLERARCFPYHRA
jgi:hypothetical protein